VSHGLSPRAASPRANCAAGANAGAKPAGGIFANPADRPDGPDGQSRAIAAPTRKSGDMHSERGPGLLPPGQSMHGQNIHAIGAMRTEVAGVTTVRELWPDVWWVLA
jgi:hypothetical protein